MPEFLHLTPPLDALRDLLAALPNHISREEEIFTKDAFGRILAREIKAPHPLPGFYRSTVDGFALNAKDTFGVTESMPGYMTLIGEVPMGQAPDFQVLPGSCALIHTGGMLPTGADAVVMLEYSQLIPRDASSNTGEIEIFRAVASGENVLVPGEDISIGSIALYAGTCIRPQEIGGCMALGIDHVWVYELPKIAVISSGDEIVPPTQHPSPGEVRDVNSYSLASLIQKSGGIPVLYGIVHDDQVSLESVARKALVENDAIIITAGSSASARDNTAKVVEHLGKPGVLAHGLNIRPGKPTILAVCEGKPVIGLPGNPVSALIIGGLFIPQIVQKLTNQKITTFQPSISARLTVNVSSIAGREDWVPVRLIKTDTFKNLEEMYYAEPVFSKSNNIFSLVKADGVICIPSDCTGISAGEKVQVLLM